MESVRSIKSIRSLKSRKSSKSLKSGFSEYIEPELPTFEEVLPMACRKYSCDFNVFVKKEIIQDAFYQQLKLPEKPVKYKKITVTVPTPVSMVEIARTDTKTVLTTPSEISIDENAITVISLYDKAQNLTEIKLSKVPIKIPRALIQIIILLASSYDYLSKITIERCKIDSRIIYDLSKLLDTEYITDICLDGSPVKEGNYFILLDLKHSRIKYLSLCRCNISDEECMQIAVRLNFTSPAEKTLQLLNLSSNRITDEGAKHLGEALRSNRRLRYLNLADNRITDDGARAILEILMDFRLTHEETKGRRRRLVTYLNEKKTLVEKYLNECEAKSPDEYSAISRKSGKKKKTSATSLKNKGNFKKDIKKEKVTPHEYYNVKAELFANEIMGPLIDPFDLNSIKFKDGDCFSLGNMVLCYLNLSYNQLGYISVKNLLSVLQYQRVARKPAQSGLIKVVIEGNPMPANCIEYQNLNQLYRLGKNMQQFGGRLSTAGMRKRSTRISLVPSHNSGKVD